MRAKVTNQKSNHYLSIIDVKSIDFKHVLGIKHGTANRIKVAYEDVEFIYDNKWEKGIVKYRDMLRISLPYGVSPNFYGMLSYSIEKHIKMDIRSVTILSDVNEKARKRHWYKKIVMLVNGNHPLSISASGRDFIDRYNIDIEDIDVEEFISQCKKNMDMIKGIIDMGINQLICCKRVISRVKNQPKISERE